MCQGPLWACLLHVLCAAKTVETLCACSFLLFPLSFSFGCVGVTPRRPGDSGPEKPVAPRCLLEQARQSGGIMESLNLFLEGVW